MVGVFDPPHRRKKYTKAFVGNVIYSIENEQKLSNKMSLMAFRIY